MGDFNSFAKNIQDRDPMTMYRVIWPEGKQERNPAIDFQNKTVTQMIRSFAPTPQEKLQRAISNSKPALFRGPLNRQWPPRT